MNLSAEIDRAIADDESGLVYPVDKARELAGLFSSDWPLPDVGTIEQWGAVDFEWLIGPQGSASLVTISVDHDGRLVWAGVNNGTTGKGQSLLAEGLPKDFISFAEPIVDRLLAEPAL